MKRMARSHLNMRKLNRLAMTGKSREVDHKQIKEPAKPSRELAIKK